MELVDLIHRHAPPLMSMDGHVSEGGPRLHRDKTLVVMEVSESVVVLDI
jgi:hypothetical protein